MVAGFASLKATYRSAGWNIWADDLLRTVTSNRRLSSVLASIVPPVPPPTISTRFLVSPHRLRTRTMTTILSGWSSIETISLRVLAAHAWMSGLTPGSVAQSSISSPTFARRYAIARSVLGPGHDDPRESTSVGV